MSNKPPPGLTEDDFETIEDAVMETARGRWFLKEFARRARARETGVLLEALTRIERAVAGQGGFAPEAHAQALDERQGRLAEISWTLRERGYDGSICTLIENEARALSRIATGLRGDGPMMENRAVEALPAPAPAPVPVAPPAPEPARVEPPSMPARPRARVEAPPAIDNRLAALAALDGLPPREKAALFA